jgi:hypothetical protein
MNLYSVVLALAVEAGGASDGAVPALFVPVFSCHDPLRDGVR